MNQSGEFTFIIHHCCFCSEGVARTLVDFRRKKELEKKEKMNQSIRRIHMYMYLIVLFWSFSEFFEGG